MEDIINRLDAISDSIINEKRENIDSEVINIMKLKDLDNDIKETLVLLHSNYRTAIYDLESKNNKRLNDLISISKELTRKLENASKIAEDANKLAQNAKHGREGKAYAVLDFMKELSSLEKLLVSSIFIVLFLFILYHISPDGFNAIADTIQSVIGSFSSTS